MGSVVRSSISASNKYYIPKHRYYELKHFCLSKPPDDFGGYLIKKCCIEADGTIWKFIYRAVTEDISYVTLATVYDIPCGKDYYYERYRKFFWLLSNYKSYYENLSIVTNKQWLLDVANC